MSLKSLDEVKFSTKLDAEDKDEIEFEKLLGSNPCVSRPSMKPMHGLRIVRPGKPDKIVEYYGIDGDGDNASITFITGAHRVWQITLIGRNLSRLLGYLKEHRLDWIKQADRDSFGDKELFIKGIAVKLLPMDEVGKAPSGG